MGGIGFACTICEESPPGTECIAGEEICYQESSEESCGTRYDGICGVYGCEQLVANGNCSQEQCIVEDCG